MGGSRQPFVPGGAAPTRVSVQRVVRALGGVIEPDYGRSIVSLGLIRGIHVTDRGRNVVVEMTLTSPRSPHGLDLVWAGGGGRRRARAAGCPA